MKKIIRFLPIMIALAVLVMSILMLSHQQTGISENSINISQESEKESKIIEKQENISEMRGIWIPYMTLDLSGTDRSEQTFRNKINTILDNCQKYKMNTIIIHVRPFCDAIYPSEYFPFSHIISGKQGQAVNYDPLAIIIQLAHKKNLKIHAWINPLRILSEKSTFQLSEKNPFYSFKKQNQNYILNDQENLYWNPAYPEVRKLIINGVKELAENYAIDGIQIDDYFYPSEDLSYDKASYEEYKTSVKGNAPLSQQEWRKTNINSLVSGMYSAVHHIKKDCLFGISPQCNTKNDLEMGADVFLWGKTAGYTDYLCPQIYVSNEHESSPFQSVADQWRNIISNPSVKFYTGLALYKAGTDSDHNTWLKDNHIIQSQIEYSRKIQSDGFILYSYDYLLAENAKEEVNHMLSALS